MARGRYTPNPLLSLPRIGPAGAARIFNWKSASSWKANLSKFPSIRSVDLRSGRFFILQDVLAARYPQKNDGEIAQMVDEYEKQKKAGRNGRGNPLDWIGCTAAARLFGWRDGRSFKANLRKFPKIRKKKLPRGTYYSLHDVMAAAFQEAGPEQLTTLILDYKLERSKRASERKGHTVTDRRNAKQEGK